MFKSIVLALCLPLTLPAAAISGFGRLEPLFAMFAQAFALVPGWPGDCLRIVFYKLTLLDCSLSSRISFGTFFAHREASVGPRVYIGAYCILGKVSIGEGTQIASAVQVLSGRHQHARTLDGRISGSQEGKFTSVSIGSNCWIGAAAVVMADVGAGSTIGAGSVVVRPIAPGSVATGVPAQVIKNVKA